MEEVEQICDKVFIIHHGEIVAAGRPEDLASEDNLIEIKCDNAAAAKVILRELSDILQVEMISSNQLEILAPRIRASRVNQFLIDQGITVDQIVVKRESLEDVFFRLTGRERAGTDNFGSADNTGSTDE